MRTLVVGVGDYSLDGIIGEAGGPFFNFCRSIPDDPAHFAWTFDEEERADIHIFGRKTYEVFASYFPNLTDDPTAEILNKGRKVVFSSTLKHVDWANTTIASGDLVEEITKLKADGDGKIAAYGGISFLRSLVRHDLVDMYRLTVYPYIVGSGATLFDVSESRPLELVSGVAFGNGVVGLTYRRRTE
ncbi:MAG: dihydrofolate reductase family protein [Micromonosporaceae bacterium]